MHGSNIIYRTHTTTTTRMNVYEIAELFRNCIYLPSLVSQQYVRATKIGQMFWDVVIRIIATHGTFYFSNKGGFLLLS